MTQPTNAQIGLAKRLLANEGAGGTPEGTAMAAERVYDKLQTHLAPLIGTDGLQSLILRSAKLSQRTFAFLGEIGIRQGSTSLQTCLQSQDAALALEAAATLFGTFFALITTFIGERLTTQVLRRAWPTIVELAAPETE